MTEQTTKQKDKGAVTLFDEKQTSRLKTCLPNFFDETQKQQFLLSIVKSVNAIPKLKDMAREASGRDKIYLAAYEAAEAGLSLGTSAYLIPFKGSVKMIADYKGILDIWRRHKDHDVKAPVLVHANDKFEIVNEISATGDKSVIRHRPNYSADRGGIIGGYIAWRVKDVWDFLFVTRKEIDDIAGSRLSDKTSPWKTHYDAMAKKTVVKQACRYGNTQPSVVAALRSIDQNEDEFYGSMGAPNRPVASAIEVDEDPAPEVKVVSKPTPKKVAKKAPPKPVAQPEPEIHVPADDQDDQEERVEHEQQAPVQQQGDNFEF